MLASDARKISASTCRFRDSPFVLLRDQSGGNEEEAMKYVVLIYQGTALEGQAALPEDEQKQVYADYQGINQRPGVTPGVPMGLPENATTVRVEGGKTLTTDGPFVGMKEAVGGWFILEADNLDTAIEVAARHPAAHVGRLARGRLRHGYRAVRRAPAVTCSNGCACALFRSSLSSVPTNWRPASAAWRRLSPRIPTHRRLCSLSRCSRSNDAGNANGASPVPESTVYPVE